MSRQIFTVMLLLASFSATDVYAQSATDAAKAGNAADGSSSSSANTSAEATSAKVGDAGAQRQAASGDKAEKQPVAQGQDEVKTLSGISILGNQDSPKSLVIVPWKGSEIGEMPGLSRLLDDSVQPIDKEVFMRELDYYEIRSNSR
jgi:hypothetical protein